MSLTDAWRKAAQAHHAASARAAPASPACPSTATALQQLSHGIRVGAAIPAGVWLRARAGASPDAVLCDTSDVVPLRNVVAALPRATGTPPVNVVYVALPPGTAAVGRPRIMLEQHDGEFKSHALFDAEWGVAPPVEDVRTERVVPSVVPGEWGLLSPAAIAARLLNDLKKLELQLGEVGHVQPPVPVALPVLPSLTPTSAGASSMTSGPRDGDALPPAPIPAPSLNTYSSSLPALPPLPTLHAPPAAELQTLPTLASLSLRASGSSTITPAPQRSDAPLHEMLLTALPRLGAALPATTTAGSGAAHAPEGSPLPTIMFRFGAGSATGSLCQPSQVSASFAAQLVSASGGNASDLSAGATVGSGASLLPEAKATSLLASTSLQPLASLHEPRPLTLPQLGAALPASTTAGSGAALAVKGSPLPTMLFQLGAVSSMSVPAPTPPPASFTLPSLTGSGMPGPTTGKRRNDAAHGASTAAPEPAARAATSTETRRAPAQASGADATQACLMTERNAYEFGYRVYVAVTDLSQCVRVGTRILFESRAVVEPAACAAADIISSDGALRVRPHELSASGSTSASGRHRSLQPNRRRAALLGQVAGHCVPFLASMLELLALDVALGPIGVDDVAWDAAAARGVRAFARHETVAGELFQPPAGFSLRWANMEDIFARHVGVARAIGGVSARVRYVEACRLFATEHIPLVEQQPAGAVDHDDGDEPHDDDDPHEHDDGDTASGSSAAEDDDIFGLTSADDSEVNLYAAFQDFARVTADAVTFGWTTPSALPMPSRFFAHKCGPFASELMSFTGMQRALELLVGERIPAVELRTKLHKHAHVMELFAAILRDAACHRSNNARLHAAAADVEAELWALRNTRNLPVLLAEYEANSAEDFDDDASFLQTRTAVRIMAVREALSSGRLRIDNVLPRLRQQLADKIDVRFPPLTGGVVDRDDEEDDEYIDEDEEDEEIRLGPYYDGEFHGCCWNCGEYGHRAADCDEEFDGECYRCGEYGHRARDCY